MLQAAQSCRAWRAVWSNRAKQGQQHAEMHGLWHLHVGCGCSCSAQGSRCGGWHACSDTGKGMSSSTPHSVLCTYSSSRATSAWVGRLRTLAASATLAPAPASSLRPTTNALEHHLEAASHALHRSSQIFVCPPLMSRDYSRELLLDRADSCSHGVMSGLPPASRVLGACCCTAPVACRCPEPGGPAHRGSCSTCRPASLSQGMTDGALPKGSGCPPGRLSNQAVDAWNAPKRCRCSCRGGSTK